jgi:hypothetical protein
VSLDCIHNLIRGNHFESATFAIENSKNSLQGDEMLQTGREAITAVRSELAAVREKVEA